MALDIEIVAAMEVFTCRDLSFVSVFDAIFRLHFLHFLRFLRFLHACSTSPGGTSLASPQGALHCGHDSRPMTSDEKHMRGIVVKCI
jgi:hypothetical protein